VAPVLGIEATRLKMPDEAFDLVIFVSVHAANLGKSQLRENLTWYAVGATTASALQRSDVLCPSTDNETSEGLLELPGLQEGNGRGVLLVCGEGGRSLLQDTLRERGFNVQRLEVYRRIALEVEAPTEVEIIVVGSAQGMRLVADQWLKGGGDKNIEIVVPSLRVAEIGHSIGFKNVHNSAGAAMEETYTCVRKLVERHD
jgi:uroporphyrinogen-III synthase